MPNEIVDKKDRKYLTESEARTVKDMFKKYFKLYKEGIELVEICKKQLVDVEKEIEILEEQGK